MMNAIHLSLDLETLSLASNAGIIQIGAISTKGDIFNSYADPTSSSKMGLDCSRETLMWWDKQDPALRKRVMSGTKHLSTVLTEFHEWCLAISGGDLKRIYLWSKPGSFDIPKLVNAYETFMTYPFYHRQHMCSWSVAFHAGIEYPVSEIPHDALEDAKAQCAVLIELGY